MHPCAQASAAREVCPLRYVRYGDSISWALAGQNNITSDMNKHQRQGREPPDQTTLPDDIGSELSRITTEVIDVSDAAPIAPPAPLSPDEVRTILMSLLLTMFLAALEQTIVATALPTLGRQFGDVTNLSWVITAYLLAATAVAPVFGTLSDIYGRRVMVIISLNLFIAGSVLCAVAWSLPVLILARGLQGLGGVVIMLVLTWGGNRDLWLSPTILSMVGSAIALALLFVWYAGRAEEPFLPLPLLGGTVAPYAIAAGGCALGAIMGLTVHLPLYYEVVYHLNPSQAGLALIPLAAISTCGAAIAGRTMARAKHYKHVAIVGTSVAVVSGFALAFTTLPLWGLLVVMSVFA